MSDHNSVGPEKGTQLLENDEPSQRTPADGTPTSACKDHPFELEEQLSAAPLHLPPLHELLATLNEDAPYDPEVVSHFTASQTAPPESLNQALLEYGIEDRSTQFHDDQQSFVSVYNCNRSGEPISYILDPQLEPMPAGSPGESYPSPFLESQPTVIYPGIPGLPYTELDFPQDFDLESATQRLLDNWSEGDNCNLTGMHYAYLEDPQSDDNGKGVDRSLHGQYYQLAEYSVNLDTSGFDTSATSPMNSYWLPGHSSLETPLLGEPVEPQFGSSHVEPAGFDSDATIDLEEFKERNARASRAVSSIGEYLMKMSVPSKEKHGASSDPDDPISKKPKRSAPKRKADEDAPDEPQPKRGRGRPIVPGSLRQKRLQAMAQPDYVPPKRGRPRTSDRHLKKRSRRAKTAKVTSQPTGQAAAADGDVENQHQEMDSLLYDDDEDQIRYKPIYFILSAAQALKVQQLYNVPAPKKGWAEQDLRWQITYNLQRVSPTGSFLIRELTDRYQKDQQSARNEAKIVDKENQVPAEDDNTALDDDCMITEWRPYAPQQKFPLGARESFEKPQGCFFPDERLRIATGDANAPPRLMTQPEVLEKLLDERDVYFRCIIWELLKGTSAVAGMSFTGTMNRMMRNWEFV
ncbi:hypothetical protein ABW21_db0203518 [Orbilia brochopaga]|nr:hypothetical protein ABW21_db0203518 [Drechslerella brochopaga]